MNMANQQINPPSSQRLLPEDDSYPEFVETHLHLYMLIAELLYKNQVLRFELLESRRLLSDSSKT